MLRLVAATLAVGPIAAAHSDELTLICESARREYLVSFRAYTNTFRANNTYYRVLAVERDEERLVVVGLTVNDGPTFRAHFRRDGMFPSTAGVCSDKALF